MNEQTVLTVKSTLRDDPDFDQIEISVRLLPGKTRPLSSSFAVERAVLKWTADHTPTWVDHCLQTGMKTLG